MRSDCTRWISIADREALGDAVSDEEAKFRRAHGATCVSCASEAAAWSSLERIPIDLPVESIEVEAVLHRHAHQPPSVVSKRTAPRGVVGLAGALAVAAAIALIWRAIGRREATAQDEDRLVRVVVASGAMHGLAGGALMQGADVVAGTSLETRDVPSCLQIDPGIRACFGADSRARVVGTLLSDRRIELLAGRVVASLEPQPNGSGFTIATKAGTISAVGTEFEVEVGDIVKIAVLKGVVLVRSSDGKQERLEAPRKLSLGQGGAPDLGTGDGHETRGDQPSPPTVPTSPQLGRSVATQTDKSAESTPPSDLLQQARDEREHGRFARAAELYRKLQATSPESAEARVALVSLGELQLSHLGDPAGALHSFDGYLRGGGGLAQEAWYGKVRALRALGRSGDERQAIEQFLAAYPSAVQASALRARLSALR